MGDEKWGKCPVLHSMHALNDDEQRTTTMSSLTSFLHQKGVNINALFNNNSNSSPPDDQNDIESSELVKTIHARSKRFVHQMSPHIDAIETNVREMTSKARGVRMTNALELHALIDSCSFSERSSSQTSEEMEEKDERDVHAKELEGLRGEIERMVESKEIEGKKEEERKEKERKERRERELREAMMFRKE
jgi:hypothetical protein|tara:strand:+ start:1006 stop:1578 length:573 start_codon:yes stop_codon:yes gene_type:complete